MKGAMLGAAFWHVLYSKIYTLYILPQILGSLPEVIRSWCAHHHHHHKVFAGRLNARGTRTRLPRRAGGA